MNGAQIEQMLEMIDRSIQRSSDEMAEYIRANQAMLAESFARTGQAVIRTSWGDLQLSMDDLEALAA